MNYLICYDIKNGKRLQKVHNLVADMAISVQLSVYTANLSQDDVDALCKELAALINKHEDDVRIYPIKSLNTATNIGCARYTDLLLL